MTISFDTHDNLRTILRRVREAPEDQLSLQIPKASVFWQSVVNKGLLQKAAEEAGKTVEVRTEDGETENGEGDRKESEAATPAAAQPAKPKQRRSWGKWIAAGLILLLLAAGSAFGAVYYYLPRATVTLKLSKKSLEKETQVRIDPSASEVNPEENIIPGKTIQSEQNATKTFEASGSKLIGEKALGEVTLQNWQNVAVTIGKGTLLTVDSGYSGEGLIFTTDVAKQISPAQTTYEEGKRVIDPGTVTVPVTAEKFGTEYNLSADTSFVVEKYAFENFSAINKTTFSGGTTESVTIIAQEDLNKAQEQLKTELFAQGEEALQEKISESEKIAQETIDHATTFAEFSKEVGAEAKEFELSMRTTSTAVAYKEKQLKSLLAESLKTSVPDGFKLSDADEVITVKDIQRQSDETLLATGVIKTLVVPDIDTGKIKEKLVGVKPQRAQEILKNTPRLAGFEFSITPQLPGPLATLPHRPERLDLQIEVE